jgi:hypothetical protein
LWKVRLQAFGPVSAFVFDNERTVTNPYLLPPAVLRCTSCGYNLPATWSEAGVGLMSFDDDEQHQDERDGSA